jgi:DNA-binding transcriptional LysR family regulator
MWTNSDALQVPWISIGNIAAQSGQIDCIVELDASGLGVAFLPRMIAEQRKCRGVAQVLLAEPRTEWKLERMAGDRPRDPCKALTRRGL